MLNLVSIQGRLTTDLEVSYVGENDTPKVSFTLAVQKNFKNAKGEYDADFIRLVAWGGTAELLADNFGKGSMVLVEGSIQTGQYADDRYTNESGDSVIRYTTDIVVSRIHFVDSKKNNNEDSEETPRKTNKSKNGNSAKIQKRKSGSSSLGNRLAKAK